MFDLFAFDFALRRRQSRVALEHEEKLRTVVVGRKDFAFVPDDQAAASRQTSAKRDNLLGDVLVGTQELD